MLKEELSQLTICTCTNSETILTYKKSEVNSYLFLHFIYYISVSVASYKNLIKELEQINLDY